MPSPSLRTAMFLSVTFLAAACSSEPPKCSDESTLNLVRKILLNKLKLDVSDTDMQAVLKFEYPHATALNEKIKKYSCESKLIAGGSVELPITYESQLDDGNQHLVGVSHIAMLDLVALDGAIRADMKKLSAKTAVPAVPSEIVGIWRGKLEGDGEMKVSAGQSGFDVELNVGAENCGGSIEGVAQLLGNTLTLRKTDDDQTCTISAVIANRRATITEDNCTLYHGMVCGFDGTLEKVK